MLAQLVDGDDVGVLEPRRRLGLALEAHPRVRVPQPDGHDLHGHVALQRLVAAAVDAAHGPLAEEPEDPIAPDAGRARGHLGMIDPKIVPAAGPSELTRRAPSA